MSKPIKYTSNDSGLTVEDAFPVLESISITKNRVAPSPIGGNTPPPATEEKPYNMNVTFSIYANKVASESNKRPLESQTKQLQVTEAQLTAVLKLANDLGISELEDKPQSKGKESAK